MDIKEFLQLSSGKWFSLRTIYLLDAEQNDNSKADLDLQLIDSQTSEIINLCQEHNFNPDRATGLKISWDNSVDWGKTKQVGSVILLVIPDADNARIGTLIQSSLGKKANLGRYEISLDDVLTLTLQDGEIVSQERQWFASENLRLRSTLVEGSDRVQQTSFYSEIRKLAPKVEN
jgi:hypothetical protein